ncbi:integrase [Clostridia bacterium]|nr:integrase [Clostridia bacterium]
MLETGIYVRVSTEEQAQEGFSIRAQEQKLKDYARIKDWSIYNIYIDEGISGKNITERPAINRMLEDIEKGYVKNALVFKIDRLTRSTADLIYLVDLFNQYDCAFNSLMESIDTQTASGRMFLKIIGIFAEFERENIIERTRLGLERKAREGYSLCCRSASYGYDRPKGQKIQSINEEEAEIVREIFDMFINQNMPLGGIAKSLNMREIPTKGNSLWNSEKIKKALTNCNYIGNVRYCTNDKKRHFETKGLHEPIIAEELFIEAQSLIGKIHKVSSTKRPREENYYSGILYCAKCGSKLTPQGNYKKLKDGTVSYTGHYRCTEHEVGNCSASDMSHKKVEQAFLEHIEEIERLEHFDEINLHTLQEEEIAKQKNAELINSYNEKYFKLEKKEKEVMELYVNDNIHFEDYRNLKNKLDKDKEFIIAELEKLNDLQETKPTINKEEIIRDLKENWCALNDREKRKFILKFIKKIDVVNEKIAGVHLGTVKIKAVEFSMI